jgi:hypothetical protein
LAGQSVPGKYGSTACTPCLVSANNTGTGEKREGVATGVRSTIHHDGVSPANPALAGKNSFLSLSPKCVGERVSPPSASQGRGRGVRGFLLDIFLYYPSLPLCGISRLRDPVFPYFVLWSGAVFRDLCKAVRDSILSPQGARIIAVTIFRAKQ